jgi:hypothetical protein
MYVYINTIGLHFDPTFNERDVTYKLRKEYDLSNVDGIGGIESCKHFKNNVENFRNLFEKFS